MVEYRPARWRLLLAVSAVLATAVLTAPFPLVVQARAASAGGSTYVASTPSRLLDTRDPGQTRLPADGMLTLNVPDTLAPGATAVVLNVTAVDPSAGGFLTVYPHGPNRPSTSNVDFSPNQTTANLVMVPLNNGAIDIFSAHSATDVIVDFEGYYVPASGSSATFTPLQMPNRILDTTVPIGVPVKAPLGPNSDLVLQIGGTSAGIPDNVAAVVLNLTATGATDTSFLTAYGTGTPRPAASNVNFGPGQTVANLTVVPVNKGQITIWNHTGSTDVVADIFGYYTGGTGSTFTTVDPKRFLDTLDGTGANGVVAPLGDNAVDAVQVTGTPGTPANVTAVLLHVAVTNPTAISFLTVYPDGPVQPNTSNINFSPGQIISNSVIIPVGRDGKIAFWNHHGTVDIVADISGYFIGPPTS